MSDLASLLKPCRKDSSGFTLIEMSIVLIIIGLIVGGILVGQDLINAATIRAQISQIEKYNTAVHAFQNKYGGIPGDLALNLANQFGFSTTGCDGSSGERDGNGLLDGFNKPVGYIQAESEVTLFWQDLGQAGLIDQTFPNGGATANGCNSLGTSLSLTAGTHYIGDYYPSAKIGQGSFIYPVDGVVNASSPGFNWFGIAAITSIVGTGGNDGEIISGGGMTVLQAYNIDKKIDDGVPTSGNVMAANVTAWWFGFINQGASDSKTTCSNSTTNTYSTNISGGTNINCALAMRFQ